MLFILTAVLCGMQAASASAPVITLDILRKQEYNDVGSVKSMIQFVSQEYNYKYELVD
jgi:phosphoribosylcarboxyaminoimidazole (NCAIR) mutase